MTNLIWLANTPTPHLIIHQLQQNLTVGCPRRLSTGLTDRKLPMRCTKSAEFYANEARITKSVYYSTYRSIKTKTKKMGGSVAYKCYRSNSFFLNNCDVFLVILIAQMKWLD